MSVPIEQAVAELAGGKVARSGKKDLKLFTKKGDGVTVDVLGPNGELILVGGPAKARRLSELGRHLKTLKEVAEEKGVPALAYFEEGTPSNVLELARKWLGDDFVREFAEVKP